MADKETIENKAKHIKFPPGVLQKLLDKIKPEKLKKATDDEVVSDLEKFAKDSFYTVERVKK
jgi:hypothetical protein